MRQSGGRGVVAELMQAMGRALRARETDAAMQRAASRRAPALLHVTLDDQDVERALGNVPALRQALLGAMEDDARRRAQRASVTA